MMQLCNWKKDPANKACIQGIYKRIDVIMTMNFRKSKRDELTEQQEWELKQFEQQFRDRNQQSPANKSNKQNAGKVSKTGKN